MRELFRKRVEILGHPYKIIRIFKNHYFIRNTLVEASLIFWTSLPLPSVRHSLVVYQTLKTLMLSMTREEFKMQLHHYWLVKRFPFLWMQRVRRNHFYLCMGNQKIQMKFCSILTIQHRMDSSVSHTAQMVQEILSQRQFLVTAGTVLSVLQE